MQSLYTVSAIFTSGWARTDPKLQTSTVAHIVELPWPALDTYSNMFKRDRVDVVKSTEKEKIWSQSCRDSYGDIHGICNGRSTGERLRCMPWISKYEVDETMKHIFAKESAQNHDDSQEGTVDKAERIRKENAFRSVLGVVDSDSPLPAAVAIGHNKHFMLRLNPVVRELLVGTYDEGSPLNILCAQNLVWCNILEHLRAYWSQEVTDDGIYASKAGRAEFPPPQGININMMPILIGVEESIPLEYRHYHHLILSCPVQRADWGKIGYLTVHESVVDAQGLSQRRGGLHIETPGSVLKAGLSEEDIQKYRESLDEQTFGPTNGCECLTLAWGRGYYDGSTVGHYQGGIFMASTVDDSCRIWNCRVKDVGNSIGALGDCEHLRSCLGTGMTIPAGDIVWMTDATPHESLPLQAGGVRQYFRLVTSDVSVWYEQHSTPNSLGIKPPPNVLIVKGDKFEQGGGK
eukprot:m.296094 g.296094  ORF g.296094 m.296094 type:complete len:461 (+) comp20054_c0_seq15:33-1415(+)